jgi:simple sugar transport system ATP-binding protein
VDHLSKRFGGLLAVDEVSFVLRRAEVLALVGENGAGKSTLIGLISGDHKPDAGTVKFQSILISHRSPKQIRDLGIETVYQDLALAENLNAASNIFLGREITRSLLIRTTDKRRMSGEAEKTLSGLGFKLPDRNRPARALSGGQRQGVAIGRAVHWDAQVLILDEPTAAVGVEGRRRIRELIKRFRAEGKSVLYATPNVREAFELADRLLVVRKGRCVAERLPGSTSIEEVVGYIVGARQEGARNA